MHQRPKVSPILQRQRVWPASRRLLADLPVNRPPGAGTLQRKVGFEYELGAIATQKNVGGNWVPHTKGEVIANRTGYRITADINNGGGSQVEFIITEIDENNATARRAIENAARAVVRDIAEIMMASRGNWVGADQVQGVNGSANHQFQTQGRWDQLAGQLQMTGGVHISKLAAVVSGRAHAANRPHNAGNYDSRAHQPLWHAAQRAMANRFPGWWASERDVLTGVITILVQIPLNARGALPGGQAQFLARTDYSKILLEATRHLGRSIPFRPFLNAVMDTINSNFPTGQQIRETDHVFPRSYRSAGVRLTGVTLARWVQDMLPHAGTQGTDRITSASFPGTQAQRRELRAFGGFGSQTDPGDKLIFEWRNLTISHPQELPTMVRDLVEYVRRANQPTSWELLSSVASTTVSTVGRIAQNPYVRTAALMGGAFALHAVAPVMMKSDPSRPPAQRPFQLTARIVIRR